MSGRTWLERPQTIRRLWAAFALVLLLTLLAEFLVHPHAVFGIDGSFGFNAWFGFLACVALIAVAKALGIFLKRPDSYYDD